MRIRFSFVVALALALALPVFVSASTVHRPVAAARYRHVHRHVAHAAHVARARHVVHARQDSRLTHAVRTADHLRRHGRLPQRHLVTATAPRPVAIQPLQRVRWVPPLRGSRASLLRQNERDTAEGLIRFQDDADLDAAESAGKLVLLPASAALRINPSLPMDRRYCRPWVARFLADLARVHYARFHRPLQVNSAVRTVSFQRHLLEINGNAAPAEGDLASPHLTGAAIDIGKKGMSLSEIAWMRAWLLPLQTSGKIDVEEEFYQACFHISIYQSYVPGRVPRRHPASTLLAAGVQ